MLTANLNAKLLIKMMETMTSTAQAIELEEKYGGDFKVFIGEEFFFVQLVKNDLLYYQAVPRFARRGTGEGGMIR